MTIKPKNWKNFRKIIIDTIKKDKDAMPGRAGETPISDLACMFEKLKDKEAGEAIQAIIGLMNSPPNTLAITDPKEFWFNITFLSQFLEGEKNLMKDAFFVRLFGSKALNRNLLIWVLNGYIASGGVLDQAQLNGLSFLRDEYPAAWLDAAVQSRHFEFVKKETLQLLREEKISSRKRNAFIMSLDSWKKSWLPEEDFFKIVEDFQDAAQDSETREELEGWIRRRKNKISSNIQ